MSEKTIITWIKTTSWKWIKSNWLIILIFGILMGFVLMQTFAMASQMSALNDVLNDKTDEITELKLEIVDMEKDLDRMNTALAKAQSEMDRQNAKFWRIFGDIQSDSENQTPEEVVEGWLNTWPGRTN